MLAGTTGSLNFFPQNVRDVSALLLLGKSECSGNKVTVSYDNKKSLIDVS